MNGQILLFAIDRGIDLKNCKNNKGYFIPVNGFYRCVYDLNLIKKYD